MCKITATILKSGGLPVAWTCNSKEPLTSAQCEKKFSRAKEAGKTAEEYVSVTDFQCIAIESERKPKRGKNVQ
ncbi:hypothetical protein M977_03920 [Buttiauxella gaviniae ATCC 51604]|uniref:DUF1187 family protein n=1 Tax=Buttiauxella gaviniae ATCC 51604 TaxID=1354253 RepID=A0A1B7HQK1_9ENTR|nr:DUF1187 family protein [Buttiauxella gaviniae]OAT17914.1 hypothetical protein M977_03920 [Buttiauxella gaviniae ATCC 51604]